MTVNSLSKRDSVSPTTVAAGTPQGTVSGPNDFIFATFCVYFVYDFYRAACNADAV